jgi:oligogalacturonide lyase
MARTRRWFLLTLPAACLAQTAGKGRIFPSAVKRYADPATEFTVARLTDPEHASFLPAYFGRAIARRGNFLIYSSDLGGRLEAFRLDLKNGQSKQITEAEALNAASLTLLADDHGFYYFDGAKLMASNLSNMRAREVYRVPEGFESGPGSSVTDDGQYAAVIEKKGSLYRLQLIQTAKGAATKLFEGDEELRDPIIRPRRASVLYRRGGAVWLANFDGQQNYRLRLAEGETGPAMWSPDGRSVLYLSYPEDKHKLHSLREFKPDTNEDKLVANTSQFVNFGCNADATVFVGASESKASPYVLLLVRAVKRELTLAEHKASDPRTVAPVFSPNSQRVYYGSDEHGKMAIYSMAVEKLVEETEAN